MSKIKKTTNMIFKMLLISIFAICVACIFSIQDIDPFNLISISIILAMFVTMIALGLYFYRKYAPTEDMYIKNFRLPPEDSWKADRPWWEDR